MQHYGLRQFGRTVLTIAGIILLVIFGTRAASQANSVTAVGGESKKHTVYPISLTAPQLVAISAAPASGQRIVSYIAPGSEVTNFPIAEHATATQSGEIKNKVATATKHVKGAASKLKDEVADITSSSISQSKTDIPKPQHDLAETDVK